MSESSVKQVLITGANGFIGGKLMQYLSQQGMAVVGVDLKANGDNVHQGDIGKPDSISALLSASDVVIHTAALVSNAIDDMAMWQVNVEATAKLIAAAKQHGVRRFVHVSSIVAYGNAASGEVDEQRPVHACGGSYVLTKLAAEHAALQAHASGGIEVVIVRLGDVYGPGSRPWIIEPLEAIARKQLLLPANGQGYFRPTYIDDIVRGIGLAVSTAQAAGEIINLCCSGYVTTAEYFGHICRWKGIAKASVIPTWVALLLARVLGVVAAISGKPNELTPATIYQLTTKCWYSNAKAERLLGWQPQVSLDQGMELSRQWAQQQGLL